MSLAVVHSRAAIGVRAPSVRVETHISNGLPGFSIVGLPETVVKESKDRVRSALLNSHFQFPTRRITVNLAPADLPKEGGRFDLPIALGILAASHQIPLESLASFEFAGELGLSGQLCSIQGALPFSLETQQTHRSLIIPLANADEAALVKETNVFPAQHLLDVCAHLTGHHLLKSHPYKPPTHTMHAYPDLSDVRGQTHARRALEIAAAGRHHLLLIGPPGTGKTMLASRLPGLLPPLSDQEALEIAALHSLKQKTFDLSHWQKRPFRSPHHTASSVALVGGGNPPNPGEISLAHHGILFLDELPEFNRHVLEALREPLESGTITISRAAHQTVFPTSFQLVAAMNPCPCGHLNNPQMNCRCTKEQIERYHAKLSGPFLDRIDMQVDVPMLSPTLLLTSGTKNETSQQVRERVSAAYTRQYQRSGKTNAHLSGAAFEEACRLGNQERQLLEHAIQQFKLSARAYHRLLKVARTIADLDNTEHLLQHHITEALSYRKKLA